MTNEECKKLTELSTELTKAVDEKKYLYDKFDYRKNSAFLF